jgi:glycosyltransferase involved in cell wall biosynthesis
VTALEQAPTEVHPALDVVIPVYNEERDLEPCVRRLRDHLDSDVPVPAVITIADNASTDRTWSIATRLAEQVPGVRAIHLEQKGRGRALRRAWSESEADIVAYTDVDLSTDLNALLPLVAPILSGHSDMAIGSRLARGARVRRGPKRELISRSYNLILRTALGNGFSDAQCGFKAMRRSHADVLLPAVQDNAWFFDTELLVLAERNGLRIHEVPVDWTDDPDSRVHLTKTALEDLRGVKRLLRDRLRGADVLEGLARRHDETTERARFARVGVVSTLVFLGLFLAFRLVSAPYLASLWAVLLSSAANLVAHYRYTFHHDRHTRLLSALGGVMLALGSSVLTTSLGLLVAASLWPGSLIAELGFLVAGTAVAAVLRFAIFTAIIFDTRQPAARPSS